MVVSMAASPPLSWTKPSLALSTRPPVCFSSACVFVRAIRCESTLFPRSPKLTPMLFWSAWSMSTCPPTASRVRCTFDRWPSCLWRWLPVPSFTAWIKPSRCVTASPRRRSRSLCKFVWSSLYEVKRSWRLPRVPLSPSMSDCTFAITSVPSGLPVGLLETSVAPSDPVFINRSLSSMFRMASLLACTSCCDGVSLPSRLSMCSCSRANSEFTTPLAFSYCRANLCSPLLCSAPDWASSSTLCTMFTC
mmetsp:Transcript_31989/g.95286  ORF Transcript_31989/g.95286 Transcript_31989/m.95286 type:complete len:248 (+) Transcript_31989:259-1002(+)